jgi:hypothetical protein
MEGVGAIQHLAQWGDLRHFPQHVGDTVGDERASGRSCRRWAAGRHNGGLRQGWPPWIRHQAIAVRWEGQQLVHVVRR